MGPNFVNRTIWTGDNLDILRGLNSASVDLIYLDPPFKIIRQYLDESHGVPLSTVWADIMQLSSRNGWYGVADGEIVGYPTQKPLSNSPATDT